MLQPLRRRAAAADTAVVDTAVVDTVAVDTAVAGAAVVWPRMVGWARTQWVAASALVDSAAVASRWVGTAGRVRSPSMARVHRRAELRILDRGLRRFAFSGGSAYAYSDYYGDYSCWQWYPGRYGYVRVWVC